MKKLAYLLSLIFLANFSFAGEIEKELDHFTSVTVIGNFKVFLEQGEKEHIEILNEDEELEDERIMYEVKGSELKISIKNDAFKKRELTIHVYYKKMLNIEARKGAWVETKNQLVGDEIELSCVTDGVIIANVECETVKASVFTSGTIRLSGTASIAEYKVTTGGFITGLQVDAKTVSAKVATGGEISCFATEKMDLKVSAGGRIKYKYEGEESNFTEKVSMGGNIEKIKS